MLAQDSTRTTPASLHDEESKGSPLLWTTASPGARGGRDLRRDNYTDNILCVKVLQKYADTFSYIKRSAALINMSHKIQPLPFRNIPRP